MNSEKIVDLSDEDEDNIEIEIVDDTPDEDKGRARKPEGAEPELPDDDEISSYSDSVKKRINKLKYEAHEQRRQREDAQRLREEAVTYAKSVQEDNQRLRKTLEEGEGLLMGQAKSRVEVQLEQAKRAYKEAYESGDADALVEAQTKLTDVQNELFRVNSYRPQPRQQMPAPPQAAPQKPEVQLDDMAMNWAKKNTWFGTDEEMTGYAYGVHERLIKQGVDPRSEAYYTQIDAAVKRVFAEKFPEAKNEVRTQRTSNVVAPAGRTSSKTPNRVVLTSTQVALAKRLGLTPEKYAAQVLKEQRNG